MLFGSISSRLVLDILSDEKLIRSASIDLQKLFSRKRDRLTILIRKYVKISSLLKEL